MRSVLPWAGLVCVACFLLGLVPVLGVIPGVILDGAFSGDRADVRCAARWASGHWALEVARRLDTGS